MNAVLFLTATAVYRTAVAVGGTGNEDIWSWLYQNFTVQGAVNITGLVLLVVLFSRDLILTKGQHERRVADILTAHAATTKAMEDRYQDMIREKDASYAEMKESRNYYRDARLQEQHQKEALAGQLVESNKALQVSARALGALDQVLPTGQGAG